jgi:hypothetical protein
MSLTVVVLYFYFPGICNSNNLMTCVVRLEAKRRYVGLHWRATVRDCQPDAMSRTSQRSPSACSSHVTERSVIGHVTTLVDLMRRFKIAFVSCLYFRARGVWFVSRTGRQAGRRSLPDENYSVIEPVYILNNCRFHFKQTRSNVQANWMMIFDPF